MTYVEVSVAGQHTKHQYFTYSSVKSLSNGQIIAVPFGKKQAYGIVCSTVNKPAFTVKPIAEVTPFILPPTSILLLHWLEQYYPYQFGELSQLFIPPNISVNARKTIQQDTTKQPSLKELTFTKDQQTAFNKIQESPHVLLHGDTGTGKTLVFLRQAQKILNNNQSVLILTPEIGLTPQLEVSIKQNCSAPLFTTHSQMTPAARKKVWMQAYNGNKPAVYLGPRSSLFLPFKNLGLIVIDESHDSSFDNMQSPKYHGLYVAAKLANIHKACFIQSSATPNVTDYVHAVAKKVPILRMQQMPLKNTPANGQIIDMTNKDNLSTNQLFSKPLLKALTSTIQADKQSLL
ncbi:DEAD/DEAH box helicase, partial [Candidatus Saccharibacteria bacterium]|nr:DEAD/DEAH box helicase [Candidatus Saccharibacteria bacterium]